MQPDGFESLLLAPFHLSDVFLGADVRHDRDADQSIAINGAIFFDEVIVESANNREKRIFVFDFRVTRFAGEQKLAVDAVGVLFFEPLLRRAGSYRPFEVQMDRIEFFQ